MKKEQDSRSEKAVSAFSTLYGTCRDMALENASLQETPENELHFLWQQLRWEETQQTLDGHTIRVISPGWWNKREGPDFINAQIEFNGKLVTGDVEIHCQGKEWYHHGHHEDTRYNQVVLHAVQQNDEPRAVTSKGTRIATWLFPSEPNSLSYERDKIWRERCGACAQSQAFQNPRLVEHFLDIAGDWRIREKERRMNDRIQESDFDQALYESIFTAFGYSAFKKEFEMLARIVPYKRALQLSREDPLALEAAYLRLAGFLPLTWEYTEDQPRHYKRLKEVYDDYLAPLETAKIDWKKPGVRPANRPERRLAAMAGFMSKVALHGLKLSLELMWCRELSVQERLAFFQDLFRKDLGFWAYHFMWNGKQLARRNELVGEGRMRSILGNILIPAGLALSHSKGTDPVIENRVHEFFSALPAEPSNSIYRAMLQWIVPPGIKLKLNFRRQQGLLQLNLDWCQRNPSCQNCILPAYLRIIDEGWNIPAELVASQNHPDKK